MKMDRYLLQIENVEIMENINRNLHSHCTGPGLGMVLVSMGCNI